MRKTATTFLVFWIFLVCCNKQENAVQKKLYFDIPEFMNREIAALTAGKIGLEKKIIQGESIEQFKGDTIQWNVELQVFSNYSLNNKTGDSTYRIFEDSSGAIKIVNYEAKDTNAELRMVRITYVKNRLELIEMKAIKNSWIVDRQNFLSYQPGKGFGITVKENYFWKSPTEYEIFGEIRNPVYLKK